MIVFQKIYDEYWKFAFERQEIFFRKIENKFPFTSDPILSKYKFCNAFRASDRVSQFLINRVIYTEETFDPADTVFRIFLFRLLNKSETWKRLSEKVGGIKLSNFETEGYSKALSEIKIESGVIYGNAFILCANKAFGFEKKQDNHLALLDYVFRKSEVYRDILEAKSLKSLFLVLKKLPLIGNFMAYQIAIDLNYSELFDFDENEFTVAGPGAIRGINKCFRDKGKMSNEEIIMYMVKKQDNEFKRLGLKFRNLWGRKLKAIDCQNLFCEVDKYCRVKYPEIKSNRIKIKTEYRTSSGLMEYGYPRKWGILY